MSVPPDGTGVVTRRRAVGAAPVLTVVAACAGVVALLGAGVRADFGPQLRVDAEVAEALYAGDDRARALHWLLEVLTVPGSAVVRYILAVPVLVWLVRRRAWRAVGWVVLAAGLVSPLTSVLKDFFGRVRPAFEDGGARLDSLSYPSGHSSGIATLVAVGLLLAWPLLAPAARRRWLVAGGVAVLVVGATRLWLGVHFLSDVLGGWALGLGWTLLTAVLLGVLPGGRGALR